MSFIEIQDLCKIYGKGETEVDALQNVSLTIEKGEFVAITGPSGSGKSSVLLALAGVIRLNQAHISFDAHRFADSTQHESPRARKVGLITQDNLLYPHLDVTENLQFGQRPSTSLTPSNPIVQLLEIDHLLNQKTRHLSGGERQRVAIGRALLRKPQLLLADEPFGALDNQTKQRIIDGLKDHLHNTQTALLLVSHDQTVLQQMCSITIPILDGTVKHNE